MVMATLLPWSNVEIGDLDVFMPALPALVVYTWYVDDEPESTVTYFWQDEDTGDVKQEILFIEPVGFDEAVDRAQNFAADRKIRRIHVKHARTSGKHAGRKPKARRAAPARKARTARKAASTKKHSRRAAA